MLVSLSTLCTTFDNLCSCKVGLNPHCMPMSIHASLLSWCSVLSTAVNVCVQSTSYISLFVVKKGNVYYCTQDILFVPTYVFCLIRDIAYIGKKRTIYQGDLVVSFGD